jgi:hypothetical protein
MPRLSLKPVQKALKDILEKLERDAKKAKLTPRQKKELSKDIKNVKKLAKSIPVHCKSYDVGIG